MDNRTVVYQEQVPFWQRKLWILPYWLIGILVLLLLIYLAYKNGYLDACTTKAPAKPVQFADRSLLVVPYVSPASARMPGIQTVAQ